MITQRSLLIQAAVWLGFPAVLFLLFWFTPFVSLPLTALMVWSAWRLLRDEEACCSAGYDAVGVGRRYYMILAAVAVYVLVSGIGGFVAQMPNDHAWRNAVFFDLARQSWPVVYPDGGYLCYYFLFWLPSAIVAKVTGSIMAGDLAQSLWAIWGTWIALGFIFSQTGGKARWSVLLVFVFFNAWDFLASAFFSEEYYNIFENPLAPQFMWLSTTSSRFGNSANPVFYNFIYNQAIPVWVFVGILQHRRKHPESLLFWFSLLVGYAPIPSLAFAPYLAYKLLSSWRRSLSLYNLAGFCMALAVSAFLLSNNSGGNFRVLSADGSVSLLLLMSLCYAALSYGVYIPFVWPYIRRCPLFWSLLAMSIVVPLFGIGTTPDLAWRISVPLVVLLCTEMCRRATVIHLGSKPVRMTFLAVLVAGSFSSVYTLFRTGVNELETMRGERDRKYIFMLGRISNPQSNPYYNNFVASGNSFYSRFLMPVSDDGRATTSQEE